MIRASHRRLIAPLSAFGLALVLAAPASAAERGFRFGPFSKVEAAGPFDVRVFTGKPLGARAVGDSRALDRLEIEVRGDTLYIGTKKDWSGFWGGTLGRVVITVGTPPLKAAALTGSGNLAIDHVEGPAFDLRLTGSGDAGVARADVARLGISLTGSGDATVAGRARSVDIDLTGSGNVHGDRLQAGGATVAVMGSGDVTLTSSGQVSGRLMGSGDVIVRGGARCSVSKLGSGDLRC